MEIFENKEKHIKKCLRLKKMTERKKNQNEWKFYNSGSTVARMNAYMVRDCNESQTSETRQAFGQLLDLDKHE